MIYHYIIYILYIIYNILILYKWIIMINIFLLLHGILSSKHCFIYTHINTYNGYFHVYLN